MRKIKIVAPGGNKEKIEAALKQGADIIFVGGKMLNLRAGTQNFSDEELKELTKLIHNMGKKIQVNLNAVPFNDELDGLMEYSKFLEEIGIDGVIISDLGVFQCVRENTSLEITIQTHSSNTNWRSIEMWKKLGAKKVVLDRDITLNSILEIRTKVPDIKIEVLVHGPVSMAISRRPLLSNYMREKSIEKNPNLEKYSIVEETRPGEHMPIFEDIYGTYIYSAKDLCTLDILEKILDLGIDSIKIDGGMKDEVYISTVVGIYNEALNSYLKNQYFYKEEWMEKLKETTKLPFMNWFKN
ncbi:MAG: peptidase U32 family protein [Fusobacteriaceae bacterium]